jgi:hypothetical protein
MGTPDLSPGTLPFLSAIPDVDDMWGYVWSGFNHIAARPTAAIATAYVGKTLIKGWLPLALRLAPDLVLPAVRPRTRMDFSDRLEAISETFIDALMTLVERRNPGDPNKPPLDRRIFDVQVGSAPSPREHIAAVLTGRTSQGKTVDQSDAVGMDDYPQLDTANGRLNQALLLGEGRHWSASAPLLAPEEIRRGLAAAKQFGREAYRHAEKYPAPLPDDVLRESVRRVVEHPAVQGMARFFASARVGGRSLDPVMGTRLARDVGLFAVGEPLPPRTREQLAALVDKVAENLPTAPPEARDHLRSVVEEARAALAVLDQEPPSAYAQENWAPHIVTVDGRRVPLGELWRLSHRGPQENIVGVSSRSLTDGRLDTYSLAPLAKQYTQVRRIPRLDDPSHAEVTAESTPQPVPFEAPYVVGVKGDADTVRLALESGGEREFTYLRLVDFLFATDPVLTALPRGASVLVMGADVAGPPSHDPLSQPLAGQLLSNLWNRPVWGTSGGDEPVIVPGDPARGIPARFQLAEGDRWVGFRPEPSTVELGRIAREVLPDQAAQAADVLRWVRAIRLVHGPLLEKDDTPTFHVLLRGFWALEHWRRRGGDEEPLTWAHLRQLTARHHAALGEQEPALAPALAVLLKAATASLGFHLPLDPTAAAPRYHSRLSAPRGVSAAIAARRAGVIRGLFGEHITDSPAFRSLLAAAETATALSGGTRAGLAALARRTLGLPPDARVGEDELRAFLVHTARAELPPHEAG